MKLRIFDFYPRIPMFTVLLLFTITFFVYNDFGIRMIFGFAALLYVVLGYLIFRNNNIRLTRIKVLYIIMAAAMTVLPFTGTAENPTVYVLAIDICALAAIIGDVRRSEMAMAYKILAGFSVLIALYVIAVRIEPKIYFNGVSRFITQESRDMNRQLLRDGYGITLGGNVVFIDYVLSLCGLLTFNLIMAYKGKLRNKLVYWGILGIGALGMLIVNRKSELLAYMIAVFFCYLIHMSFCTPPEKRKILRITAVFLVAAAGGLVLLGMAGFLNRYLVFIQRLMSNYQGTGLKADVSSGRTSLWKLALTLFLDHPFFGIGWRMFHGYLPFEFSHLDNAHNNYIQLLCETGITGFLLVVVPMVMMLRETYRNIRVNRRETDREPLLMALNITSFGLQISFLIISFLDPCLYKISFWPFFAIAIMLSTCTEKALLEKEE